MTTMKPVIFHTSRCFYYTIPSQAAQSQCDSRHSEESGNIVHFKDMSEDLNASLIKIGLKKGAFLPERKHGLHNNALSWTRQAFRI